MALYNMTQLAEASSVSKLVEFANVASDYKLLPFFLVSIFFVMLMVLKKGDFADALLSSSFSCFILSLILNFGGFVSLVFPIGFLVIMALTGMWMVMMKRN